MKEQKNQSKIYPEHHFVYNSFSEYIKFAKSKPKRSLQDGQKSSLDPIRKHWDNNVNLQKAFELVDGGWKEGTDRIASLTADILPNRDGWIKEQGLESSISGAVLDVGEYLSGVPECFLEFEEIEAKKPVVKIGIPISIACNYDAESLINRGVAMLALIDTLESQRLATELWIIEYSSGDYRKVLLQEICLKRSDEPFDIDKICFPVAHPAFFRRVMFAGMENLPKETRDIFGIKKGYGYGIPETYSSPDYDILPPYEPNFFNNKKNSLTWIKEHCESVGVKVDEDIRVGS